MDKVHILKQYATQNNEDPDLIAEEPLFKEEKKLESKVPIATPRTQEAWNFLGNLWEILHLRYNEKLKPKQIGKMFCIRPEKLNSLVSQYVIGIEERYWAREEKQLLRDSMWQFRIELVKEALQHLRGKVITTHLIMDTIMHLNEGKHIIDRWEIQKILKKHLNYSWRKPQIRPVDAFRMN